MSFVDQPYVPRFGPVTPGPQYQRYHGREPCRSRGSLRHQVERIAVEDFTGAGAFSGVTGFTIVAMLGLFIFIAVITLQCLEIFHLDGTMDDGNSIWPPKP